MTSAGLRPGAVRSDPGVQDVERVAVLRALPGLGDLLCLVPALRALRAAHPAAHVTLVGLASARWFVDRFDHLCDDLLVVEGVRGLPEVTPDPAAERAFLRRATAARFDLALQLHGSGVATNDLLRRLHARRQVRVRLPDHARPPGVSVPYPTDRPEILRLLAVVEAAGCPPRGTELELPVTPAEEDAAARLVAEVGGGRPVVGLHPGASVAERAWAAEGFAEVGDDLAARGYAVALTGTPGDRARVDAVARRMTAPVTDLVGRTDIGVLGALYRRAALVVSNDTGAAHVAAAVRAPSVVVTASPEPHRWAPLDHTRHRTVTAGGAGEGDGDGAAAGPGGRHPRRAGGRAGAPAEVRDAGAWPRRTCPGPGGWPDVTAVLAAVDRQLAAAGEGEGAP